MCIRDRKYAGLDGTEIAISESQERMAVVVDPKDVDEFMGYAKEENLEATVAAVVTAVSYTHLTKKVKCKLFYFVENDKMLLLTRE